jgi:hypothetical protein
VGAYGPQEMPVIYAPSSARQEIPASRLDIAQGSAPMPDDLDELCETDERRARWLMSLAILMLPAICIGLAVAVS